jgi:hypothetical protein
MRAVSLLGLAAGEPGGGVNGSGGGADAGAGVTCWSGPLVADGTAGERGSVGGSIRLVGGGGNGVWGLAGRGEADPKDPAAAFSVGRGGKLIRVVSRPVVSAPAASAGGGVGKLIRTVSFLGSLESAIKRRR